MYENNSRGISYTAGFFMLIVFFIAGLMLSLIIIKPVWIAMTGEDFKVFTEGKVIPAYTDTYKVIQAINAVFSYLIPALVTASLLSRKPFQLLGFSPEVKFSQAGLAILIMLIALFVSTALAYFNHNIPVPTDWKITFDRLESEYNKQVEVIVGLRNLTDYILALIVMGFLPALCEETMFRGGLQNFLTRSTRNYWLSIIIVSLIFSAAHWSYYGFLSRFFLGIILGLIYQYSGKLWLSVLAHFVNNALALSIMYYYVKDGKTITETTNDSNSTWWGIFALPLLVGLFIYLKKISTPGIGHNTNR